MDIMLQDKIISKHIEIFYSFLVNRGKDTWPGVLLNGYGKEKNKIREFFLFRYYQDIPTEVYLSDLSVLTLKSTPFRGAS